MTRRVIFSDLHFGDEACSLRYRKVAESVRAYLRTLGHVDELILAGDILDANISSFTRAMFGVDAGSSAGPDAWPKQIGLKSWLAHLLAGDELEGDPREGARLTVGRILYLPGNHDYKVWDLIATQENFCKPIAAGTRPSPGTLPLMEGAFSDTFVSGLVPEAYRDRVTVKYPDHLFDVGEQQVLVTHGHYLDKKQTRGRTIQQARKKTAGDLAAARRLFFQQTAQYQSAANAVSYLVSTREKVDWLHKKLGKALGLTFGWTGGPPIDRERVNAVAHYLHYYRGLAPDVFIFGHTHEADHQRSAGYRGSAVEKLLGKDLDLWNSGCFLGDSSKDPVGSFVVIDDSEPAGQRFRLVHAYRGKPVRVGAEA